MPDLSSLDKKACALFRNQSMFPDHLPKRIAYVVEEFPVVSETFVFNEMLEVQRRGIKIDIYSLRRPGEPSLHVAVTGLAERTVYLDELQFSTRLAATFAAAGTGRVLAELAAARRRDRSQAWYARRSLVLAGLLRRSDVDHVHAHFATLATAYGLPASRIAGASFTLTAHRYDVFDAPISGLGRMINATDGCLGVSKPLLDELVRKHGVAAQHLRLLPCGVDTSAFSAAVADERQPNRIVTVARLSAPKDLSTAVRAAAILKERGVSFEWHVIGEGPQRTSLEAQIAAAGLSGRFLLLGARDSDAVRAALSCASVFALSSTSEGAPVAIMEAMATGLPVVSTAVGGIPDLVVNGVTGLLVPTGRPEELAAALTLLLAQPERALVMGNAGRRRAEESLSLRRQVDDLLDFWAKARERFESRSLKRHQVQRAV